MMKKNLVRTLTGALVAGGLLIAAPAAHASDEPTTATGTGNGAGAGNAGAGSVDIPGTACGIAAAGAGLATGHCPPEVTTYEGAPSTAEGNGNGIVAGNAVAVDGEAPITFCGIAAVVTLGNAQGLCH
jgi:hypothetical protein